MVALLLLGALAAVAQAPANPAARQVCTLVTPGGEQVRFALLRAEESGDEVVVAGLQDSIWPPRTLPGSRAVLEPSPAHDRRFAFGSGAGLVFELGEPERGLAERPATLFRREMRRVGLPLAYGFCRPDAASLVTRPMDPEGDPRAIGADVPAFDPRLWPERDCAVLLGDGRRARLRFTLQGTNRVEIASPDLWGGRPVVADIRWARDASGTFSRRGGPAGVQTLHLRDGGASAVKLIRFQHLGGAAAAHQTGYAICGYNNIVRRAASQ